MKRIPVVLLGLMLVTAAPAFAGTFGFYGSYWDGSDSGSTYGAGARIGFDFLKWMELEFHGTYYTDFEGDIQSQNFELTALPVDGGLKFKFLPNSKVNLYFGAGLTYYFMDTNLGTLDDEFTYYGEAGLQFGGKSTKFFVEALWRSLDTTVDDPSGDTDIDFSGVSANAGINWNW